jgi:CheY-like chemotaxis protein
MKASELSQSQVSAPSRLKGVRVLIVEDMWPVAKAMKSALERVGMIVSGPAATAGDAERLIEAGKPHVAIVDINLGHETSHDLIDHLHALRVPVIVVSGYAYPDVPAEKMAAALRKPFVGPELLAALCQVVDRHVIA